MTKKKVKIYTYSHNRPDFIELQYQTLKRHVKDDFEFIVFNNERPGGDGGYDAEKINQINQICEKIGIKCIRVELDPELQYMNGVKMFDGESYLNGNIACAYSYTWGWKNYIVKNKCLSVILDSDMFLIKDISFVDMMEGYNFSYVPSYRLNRNYVDENNRGEISFVYPWNGFVMADTKNMPNPSEISWGCGYVNNIPVDVGGEVYYYLEKYKDQIKQLYIDQWGLLVDVQPPYEICINGCSQMFADFDNCTVEIKNYQESDQRTYPHQTPRENYWEYVYKNYVDIIKITGENNFPRPTYIDFLKLEKDDNVISDSFIFHYKNASNTLPWMKGDIGIQYNYIKTQCLHNLLNLFQLQKRLIGE